MHLDKNRRALLIGLLTLCAVITGASFFQACATITSLPPISSTDQYRPGKIIWHDLLTYDMETASRFYTELFGWKFERVNSSYGQLKNGENLVGGVAEANPKDFGAYWVPLMSVTDVDHSSDLVKKAGGKILKEPFEISGRGKIAVVQDPQGAPFAVVHTVNGDPADRKAAIGDWLWNEVWTDHPDSAAAFLKTLAEYQEGSRPLNGKPYRFLKSEDQPRIGLPNKPDPKLRNLWVSYVRVADPEATAARAAQLGGKVLFAPRKDIRNGTVAILADPTGGAFLVQKWPIR